MRNDFHSSSRVDPREETSTTLKDRSAAQVQDLAQFGARDRGLIGFEPLQQGLR